MNKDIVYDETELSITANQLANYADFLADCIDEYVNLLNELKTKGIQDEKVCADIEQLMESISPYKIHIYNEGQKIKNLVNKSINEVEQADKFDCTENMMDSVRTKLSGFLS